MGYGKLHETKKWEAAKLYYISNDVSLRITAEKYGFPESTMRQRAAKEHWKDAKDAHRTKVMQKTLKKVEEKKSNQFAKLGEASLKLSAVIDKVVSDGDQFNRYIIGETEEGGAEEKIYKKADTTAINNLSRSIKNLTDAIAKIYNIQSKGEIETISIARERLELDKQKAAVGLNSDEDETGVVILPDIEAVGDE